MISASRIISAPSDELGYYEDTVKPIEFDDPEVKKYISLKYVQGKRLDDYSPGEIKIGFEF